jgi:hypothetical protein
MADDNKTLIASSEFNPTAFIQGIDAMTASLEKLSAQEDVIRADMTATNNTLKANRAELKQTEDQIKALDKTSKTYTEDLAKLNAQQIAIKNQNKEMSASLKSQKDALAQIDQSANKYKTSLSQISAISKQVAQENKGRTLFDVASLNQQVQEVVRAGASLRNVFKGKIDDAELNRFEESIVSTGDEMQQLAQVIDFVKSKLSTLDPDSQEFADLNQIVETGEQVLEQYGKVVDDVGKKGGSLRSQLRELREELSRMEDQGLENTEQFRDMQIEAAKLEDQIGDTQQRIKVLASDTRNIDFGIGVIRGVASAFGVAEGAAALFGIKNEDVMESIQRLNAIMLILNGLQEIQNLLQKQSVVNIVGQSIATKAAAVSQAIFATVVGTSTGALRAFRVALLATGIGAFVVLLGLAVEAFISFTGSSEDSEEATERFTDALERQKGVLDRNIESIERAAALRRERLREQGADEGKLLDDQNAEIEEKIKVLNNNITRLGQQANDEKVKLTKEADQKRIETIVDFYNQIEALQFQQRLNEAKRDADVAEERRKKQIDAQKKSLDLYRDYLERLAELQRELRDKTLDAQPQDESNIRQSFANSLSDALEDLDRDVNQGKLTRGRANVLRSLIRQINNVDLQVSIKEFKAEREKAETDMSRSLFDLRMKAAEERANLLRDELTREAQLIQQNGQNAEEALRRELADMITAINETRDQGLISPEAANENVRHISEIYGQLIDNVIEQTARAQEQLARRTFELVQEELTRTFSSIAIGVSEQVTAEIVRVTQKFQAGAITYEQYQKAITRIAREESEQRIATQISENEALLSGVQERLKAEQDPAQRKALEDQIIALRNTIDQLKRQAAGAEAEGLEADRQEFVDKVNRLNSYATAIGGIVNQVVSFWAAANQAEQQALDRSITLQERRVEAATRLAERGNAEYLRLEEDRLNELQIKQENAARRQLAINAVLQTSQALTAFISALAQGIATGGPLGGIAIAGAVIGLIASGYAIINSLQKNNVQTFKGGTKSVKRNGEPSGVDTVPAMLSEGEAVIPVDRNKAYAPAVAAIYDRQIPAEEMNAFVNNYRVNRRSLPKLDHDKFGDVASVVVTYDGHLIAAHEKQAEKLEENNNLLRRVHKALVSMGVNVNVDKNGLAISVLKATEQFNIDKKS